MNEMPFERLLDFIIYAVKRGRGIMGFWRERSGMRGSWNGCVRVCVCVCVTSNDP